MSFKTAANASGRTENNAETLMSSESALVDFFFKAGAARNTEDSALFALFERAFSENPRLTFQTLLWLRDVRGGAGERETFRKLIRYAAENASRMGDFIFPTLANTPNFGRFDDLLSVLDVDGFGLAVAERIQRGLQDPQESKLAAKWMPRKGVQAAKLRAYLEMSPKQWRQTLVGLSNTVEQKMCANEWAGIDYNHVPSVASARYKRAFGKHDEARYDQWKEGLATGESKVNAGAIFPHDVLKEVINAYGRGNAEHPEVIQAQWDALPNYLGDSFILPLVDVSGSMQSCIGGTTTALDVSVSLGLYLATKQTGAFSNMFVTFSGKSEIVVLKGNDIISQANQMARSEWGFNTNIQAAFQQILNVAVRGNVPQEEMPRQLLILSDMEFDMCASGLNFDEIKIRYAASGYKLPEVVFWNLEGRNTKNVPVNYTENGTALVSGYNPHILKSIMKGDLNPWRVFIDTVDVPRYQEVFKNIA